MRVAESRVARVAENGVAETRVAESSCVAAFT